MTEFFTGITALAALLAAGAAWKSARASQRGSALAQKAALLGAIPILVPWVEAESTTLKVLNRGASDAHETRWYLIQGETVKAEGPHPKIIPKGGCERSHRSTARCLSRPAEGPEFVARCEYVTSWGEALTVDRTYRNGRSAGIELRNANEELLRIAD